MRETYLTRIQTQAKGFAIQVTVSQKQLDKGTEQGRETHEISLSDADVMRRKEAIVSLASLG